MQQYLPPQEVASVNSLWTILADPQKYKALADDLVAKGKSLDEQQANVNRLMDEHRAKSVELTAREEAASGLEKSLTAMTLELENKKAHFQKVIDDNKRSIDDKQSRLDTLANQISKREHDTAIREQAVAEKEILLSNKDQYLADKQDNLEATSKLLNSKLEQLKSIIN